MPTQGGSNNSSGGGSSTSTPVSSTIASVETSSPSSSSTKSKELPQRWVKRYRTEVSASLSSGISTACAFPLDRVKTRMQTYKYAGFVDCLKHTYNSEGLRGFFRGGLILPLPFADVVPQYREELFHRNAEQDD
jgi:hypothetical protein